MTDEEFERLLSVASERPKAVRALRHADDIWQTLVRPTASKADCAAWQWLRGQLAGALLQMWEPSGRTHDPEALRRVSPERRNEYAEETYLLALGGLNLLTIAVTHLVDGEPAQRAASQALRGVGEVVAENLAMLRQDPPRWSRE